MAILGSKCYASKDAIFVLYYKILPWIIILYLIEYFHCSAVAFFDSINLKSKFTCQIAKPLLNCFEILYCWYDQWEFFNRLCKIHCIQLCVQIDIYRFFIRKFFSSYSTRGRPFRHWMTIHFGDIPVNRFPYF